MVQHQAAESPGALGRVLSRSGPLIAELARDGEPLERGRIYLAPPDRHLVLGERGVRVVFGPRENRSRPAIDVLFRSAAVHYRSRVIGVILSGVLDDGAAGLLAVRQCGGLAVVQAPSDTEHAEMPSRALEAVPDAEPIALADMAAHLARRAAEVAPEPPPVPDMLWTEARLTEGAMTALDDTTVPGESTDLTCPECRGPLWELPAGGVPRYRCRVGHAYSRDALVRASSPAATRSSRPAGPPRSRAATTCSSCSGPRPGPSSTVVGSRVGTDIPVPLPAEFPLQGTATVQDLSDFYGIKLEAPGACTLDQILRDRLLGEPEPGDIVRVGMVCLRVREMTDDRIEWVGLSVVDEGGRPPRSR